MPKRWGRAAGAGLAVLVCLAAPARAEDSDTPFRQPLRKLGRGVANMLTAPLEIIRTHALVSDREGGLAGTTVGLAQGLSRAVFREAAGVIDVLTFYMGAPNHYAPLITPEFVFAHGDWAE